MKKNKKNKKNKTFKKLNKKRFSYVEIGIVWLVVATLIHFTS